MISAYSIAVLPFTCSGSAEDKSYLADGCASDLIRALSRYSFLQVTARNSSARFGAGKANNKELGEALGVSWLIEGRLSYADKDLSLSVALIRSTENSVSASFSENTPLNKLPEVLERISGSVARQISREREEAPVQLPSGPLNPAAVEEFMKGQYLLNRLDSTRWKEMLYHLETSAQLDGTYSRPLVALCHSYTWLSSIGVFDPLKARTEIDRLLNLLFSLDSRISDVYQLQAEKLFWIEWKPIQALENITMALELNPSNSAALVMKGLILASLGKTEEALDTLFFAERLNPFGENVKYCIGLIYLYSGEAERADEYITKSLQISPGWLAPYFSMIQVFCMQDRFDELEAFLQKHMSVPGFAEMTPVFMALGAAYQKKKEEALTAVNSFTEASPDEAAMAPLLYYLALISLQLGMEKEALAWIEKGLAFRSTPFLFIRVDCSWDQVKQSERFSELIKQTDLPEAPGQIPETPAKYGKTRLSIQQEDHIRQALKVAIEEKQVFLDPKLSLSDLAEICAVTVNQLSQYLNANLGKNFYDYINSYRLSCFLELTKKKEFRHLTILGLAYESGFNSKTTFNTFFNRELKSSPSFLLRKIGSALYKRTTGKVLLLNFAEIKPKRISNEHKFRTGSLPKKRYPFILAACFRHPYHLCPGDHCRTSLRSLLPGKLHRLSLPGHPWSISQGFPLALAGAGTTVPFPAFPFGPSSVGNTGSQDLQSSGSADGHPGCRYPDHDLLCSGSRASCKSDKRGIRRAGPFYNV